MRDLALSAFVLGLVPACFRRPFVGLLVFSLLAYMRLQDLTFGFAKHQRWSFLIAIVTTIGWVVSKKAASSRRDPRVLMMLTLIVIVGLGILVSDNLNSKDLKAFVEYVKIVGVALFTCSLVNTRERLRILVWTIALSLGFFGVKSGLQGILSLGRMEIIQGPGGMMKDRNDFALALTMAMPMLYYLGASEKNKVLRRFAFGIMAMTALTVVFTYSRGAFLALSSAVVVLVWRSQNRVAGLSVMMLGIVALAIISPASWKERILSITEFKDDPSATGRLDAWKVAGKMIEGNPLLGVGFDKFHSNYHRYDPKKAVFVTGSGKKIGRVAHNSYLQIWAECGTLAFLLYVGLMLYSLWDLSKIRKLASRRYNASWILYYAAMLEASIVGFAVGAFFLNRAQFDLFYHVVAVAVAFSAIARNTMDHEDEHGFGGSRRGGPLLRVSAPGFSRKAPRPAWGGGV